MSSRRSPWLDVSPSDSSARRSPWRDVSPSDSSARRSPWRDVSPSDSSARRSPWLDVSPSDSSARRSPWRDVSPSDSSARRSPWRDVSPSDSSARRSPWRDVSPSDSSARRSPWRDVSPSDSSARRSPWRDVSPDYGLHSCLTRKHRCSTSVDCDVTPGISPSVPGSMVSLSSGLAVATVKEDTFSLDCESMKDGELQPWVSSASDIHFLSAKPSVVVAALVRWHTVEPLHSGHFGTRVVVC